jgi:hypothetical protein
MSTYNASEIVVPRPAYNHKIVIRPEKAPTGEHRRIYNAPEAREVAILIVGQNEKVTNRYCFGKPQQSVETCG